MQRKAEEDSDVPEIGETSKSSKKVKKTKKVKVKETSTQKVIILSYVKLIHRNIYFICSTFIYSQRQRKSDEEDSDAQESSKEKPSKKKPKKEKKEKKEKKSDISER